MTIEQCTAVASLNGKLFVDYYDLVKLEKILLNLSPEDFTMIKQYLRLIKAFTNEKLDDAMRSGSVWKMIGILPLIFPIRKWMKMNMHTFAEQFSDPFLKKAFADLVYANPDSPLFFHCMRHAGGMSGDIQWPVGGAGELAKSIERRYLALGGKVHYTSKVEKILVEQDRAVGIRLADGSEHRADIIISNADGRKTILNMLDGKYINDTVRGYCNTIQDGTPFAIDVFLGVNRDLSNDPSSLVLLLEQPVTMAKPQV